VGKMSIPGKSKLKKVSLTAIRIVRFLVGIVLSASRIVGLLVGIVLTGYYAISIWHVFCAHKLGWGDRHPESYLGIEDIVIFAGSAILWLGSAYWLRLRAKRRTQRHSGITPPCTGSLPALGFRRPSSPARTLTSILKVSGVILGSALFFPVSCTTALLAGIEINSFLFARDMSRGDKPQPPFYVLATVPTGNISPIELIEVDTYIGKTPDASFLLTQPSGTLPGASRGERFSWRVISSNSNEQLVEVRYYDGDTTFINRYRAMGYSVSPVSQRMWYHGYMFASFPLAIGFGLLIYGLGRYLRRKYVVRKSQKVTRWVTTLGIIIGMVTVIILPYVAHRESRIEQEQAISDFNKALEIDPRDADAYINRGIAYQREGKYEQAISDFNEAIEIDPKDADAYILRGHAYAHKGYCGQAISDDSEQAISDFNKALEINPRDEDTYINRGLTYAEKGQYDQAISDYTKALEVNLRYAKVYIMRARAYYFQREYEKSWKDVEKAQYLGLRIDPKFLDDLREASGRKN